VLDPELRPGNASSVPLRALCGDRAAVHVFPSMPAFDRADTLVLFPTADAVEVASLNEAARAAVRRVVLVEGTWTSTAAMMKHARLRGLRTVKISASPSLYWRQLSRRERAGLDVTPLSTVEAAYFFFREWAAAGAGETDASLRRFDNLLFFFKLALQRTRAVYASRDLLPPANWEAPATGAAATAAAATAT
jgi:DTW domain-containing protein YfiP